jgi:hypothetical protein
MVEAFGRGAAVLAGVTVATEHRSSRNRHGSLEWHPDKGVELGHGRDRHGHPL